MTNIGDIYDVTFINFGFDSLCIDMCRVDSNSISTENSNSDNDACGVMKCDFINDEVTNNKPSPCNHDPIWGNSTWRIYNITIEVCNSVGNVLDTISMDEFWLLLWCV